MKYKKVIGVLLASVMIGQTMFMGGIGTVHAVDAVDKTLVADADLTDNNTAAPKADKVLPNENQYKYQKEEMAAFCHFGPNTFNGVEWGDSYGDRTPDDIFTLKNDFDAETLVRTLKEAGFKKLVVTAKHHDGFCIWDSQYTEYDVASTSYQDATGQKDILAEISKACTEYNMDMGLYLSPWDIHDKSFGYFDENGEQLVNYISGVVTPKNGMTWDEVYEKDCDGDYNEYYNNQLIEILGNDKYGNAGHFTEVWMDGAKGNDDKVQIYDFEKWFDTIQKYEGKKEGRYQEDCMLFGSGAYTTVRWIGNESGTAADETWSKSKVDYNNNTINNNSQGSHTKGYPDGNQWTVPEADARITSGWFWGTAKNTPKDLKALGNMYFSSVGHNATLLLNVPPNNQGTVDQAILNRVTEFGTAIKETFKNNLAAGATVSATEVRGNDRTYSPQNVLDGDQNTYWTVNDNTNTATMVVDLGEAKEFDVVSIEEAIQFGQRISEYKVEYKKGNEWKEFDKGATIGAKRLCRRYPVISDQIRITVKTSEKAENREPIISEIGIFKAVQAFSSPKVFPEELQIIDDRAFQKTGGWKDEAGDQYLQGTDTWTNPAAGTEATVTFTGTKAWLMGTIDSGHGTADIYIDDKLIQTINMKGSSRKVQAIIFESGDLSDGQHTMKIVPKTEATGLDALLVLNNNGKGMFDFEEKSFRVNEGSKAVVKVKRIGGSNGPAEVGFEVNPGTAIQRHFDTEASQTVVFADGETEKTVEVATYYNEQVEPDLTFSMELVNPTEGAIVGFNSPAEVVITDVPRSESYTEDSRFEFPVTEGVTKVLEAEHMILKNDPQGDGNWPMVIKEGAGASNGKYVDAMGIKDTLTLYYTAAVPGEYTAKVYYQSGDSRNGITWSEESGKIENGSETIGAASVQEGVFLTKEITFKVTKAGEGVLVIESGANKGPRLDKFDITLKKAAVCAHENTEVRDAQKATCTEDGYSGDTYCTDCNTKIAEGEVISALGHKMGEWKVVKEATEEEEGLKERVCTREGCTYKETEAIPKLNPQPGEGGSDTGDGDHTNTGDGGNTNTGNGGNTNTGNGGNTSAGGQGQGAVQTGDTTSLTIWMLLLGASCTMLVLRKKESDNI